MVQPTQIRRLTEPDPLGRPSGADGAVALLADRQQRRVRYMRVSLIDRCNYRCTYCMPNDGLPRLLPKADLLRLEEIVEACRAFAGLGVERVRLTGGEPTLRKNLVWLVQALAELRTAAGHPLRVSLTTNGERLAPMAHALSEAGLSGLTVSLDSLDETRFTEITRRGHLSRVKAGVRAAREAGLAPLKINTVAVRGFNDDELGDICRWAWQQEATPRFIELMPMSGGRLYAPGELMPAAEVRDAIERELGSALVADDGEGVAGLGPARYFRVAEGTHAGRRLGTIGAMTENFCASCNRVRMTATGQLHACLADDRGADLRAVLRGQSEHTLESVVRGALGLKRDGHRFSLDGTGGPNQAMVTIGG